MPVGCVSEGVGFLLGMMGGLGYGWFAYGFLSGLGLALLSGLAVSFALSVAGFFLGYWAAGAKAAQQGDANADAN